VNGDVVALVPMRHHSERVPEKNYRPLAGRPLYEYILDALLESDGVIQVVVDTDSPVIREGIARTHPQVHLIERPDRLRGGDVAMSEILLHDAEIVSHPFYLQTHSTNPLLRPATIARAIRSFLAGFPEHDSLFSVTRLNKRFWDPAGKPVNHDPSVLLRTQDLPPIFEENSCLYLFERETFRSRRNRLGISPILFEIDRQEAWDIDDEIDFRLTEFLMLDRRRSEAGEPRTR
jgi:CMP-N-acetylneuraminic acid synthetase